MNAHVEITPVKRRHHAHPTPAHIRECCTEALADAAKLWEAETGLHVPLMRMLRAMNDGVTQACREHERSM